MRPLPELGKKVKAARKNLKWTLQDLERESGIVYTGISKFENEGTGSRRLIEKLCKTLNIDIDFGDNQVDDNGDIAIDDTLRVGFTLSHWPAPLVWINEQLGGADFFRKVNFTCWADASGKPIFNESGKRLQGFDPEIHSFFFSAEVKRLVIDGELDLGLLGSAVLHNEPDIVKVARILRACWGIMFGLFAESAVT